MAWTCAKCGADVDDELGLCWQCGTGRDGAPAPQGWPGEAADPCDPETRELACLRCGTRMAYAGRRRFHDSSLMSDVLLGDFFINREALDLFVCGACRKVELFAVQAAETREPWTGGDAGGER